MSAPVDCTEEEVTAMVHEFYAAIRMDPVLGPIFNAHVHDWDEHLVTLSDFWSSILRRTGRFSGAPMPKHIALHGLTAELFQRWLELFRTITADQPNQAMGEHAYAMAQRIAESLWYGYQIAHGKNISPSGLAQD